MNITFESFVQDSAESELIKHYYDGTDLIVFLESYSMETKLKIIIPTTQLLCPSNYEDLPSPCRICHIDIISPEQQLMVNEKGLIVPSPNFTSLMQELRNGLGLAYGFHVNKKPKIIRFIGTSLLIACVSCSIENAKIMIE